MSTKVTVTVEVTHEVAERIKTDNCPPHLMQPLLASLRKDLVAAIKGTSDIVLRINNGESKSVTESTPTGGTKHTTVRPSAPASNGTYEIKIQETHNVTDEDGLDWTVEVNNRMTVQRLKQALQDDYIGDVRLFVDYLEFYSIEMDDRKTLGHVSDAHFSI